MTIIIIIVSYNVITTVTTGEDAAGNFAQANWKCVTDFDVLISWYSIYISK